MGTPHKPDGVFQRSGVFPWGRLLNVVRDGMDVGLHRETRSPVEAYGQTIKATAQPFTRGFLCFCFNKIVIVIVKVKVKLFVPFVRLATPS